MYMHAKILSLVFQSSPAFLLSSVELKPFHKLCNLVGNMGGGAVRFYSDIAYIEAGEQRKATKSGRLVLLSFLS